MNFPVLITLVVVSTILVYVIVVSTQAWFRYEYQHEYQRKVVAISDKWLDDIRQPQIEELRNGPVPIDQAMQQVIADYQAAAAPAPAESTAGR